MADPGAPSAALAPSGLGPRLFASGSMAFLLTGMQVALYGVALPVWAEAFGLAAGEGGTLLALHGAGAFLAVLVGLFGLLVLGLRLGLVLLAVGMALIAPGSSWTLTLLGGLIGGMAFGTLAAAVNRRFLGEFGARGPGMVGLGNAVSGLGSIAAPLLLLLAAGQLGPLFWAISVLAALTIALVPLETGAVPPRGLPDLRHRRALILGVGLVAVAVEVSLMGFGPSALIDLGFSNTTTARLTSAFFVAFLLTRLSLYWLTGQVAPSLLMLAGLSGTAVCAGLAALGAPAWGFVLAGGFAGIVFPTFYVYTVGLLGSDPRIGSAVFTFCTLGVALGPLALRPMLATLGEGAVFGILAATEAALALVLAVVLQLARRGT